MSDLETSRIFVCPMCHKTVALPASRVGQPWKCTECGGRAIVVFSGPRERAALQSALAGKDSDERPREPKIEPREPPAPFSGRLARFLHCDEQDLYQDRPESASKMKFWSIWPPGPRHSPKPAWLIRLFLEHIQRLVHGPARRR